MNIKINNKGFTLVELLVTFGVLAVVMAMVGVIIGMSSRTYKNISDDINLQYESQLAMSQIHEYVIDCNYSVELVEDDSYTDILLRTDVLCLFNAHAEDELYDGYKLTLAPDKDTLILYVQRGMTSPSPSGFMVDWQPLSNNVQSFNAKISEDGKSITITLVYKQGKETYTGVQTIAFRNPVDIVS